VHGVISNIFSFNVLPVLQGTVVITGTPMVGERLTADISGLPGTGIPSFQWERSTSDGFELITGATSANYTLQSADEGKAIRVSVRRTGFVGEIISEPTAVILPRVFTVGEQIAALRVMNPLPEVITITTGRPNEQLAPQELSFAGRTITITLTRGNPVDILSLNGLGSMFTVGSGVTLILEDVELRGVNNNTTTLVVVDSGGTLIMDTGSKIAGNNNNESVFVNNMGGGVRVEPNGIFTMNGGEISGNTVGGFGGGVIIAPTSTFTMNGGKISNNNADVGGGVINYGIYNHEGGEISNNTARSGGGVVIAPTGTFIKRGGVISGNTAAQSGGGIINNGIITIENGLISGNNALHGGGILNWETITIENGIISGNNAISDGGGIANAGSLIMRKGTISNNTANDGGGVYNTKNFTIYGGEITANTAARDAGGVLNLDVNTILNMEGGIISGNTAGRNGGGVSIIFSSFNMRGGLIFNNRASTFGGGVVNYSGTFRISDGIIYGTDAAEGNTAVLAQALFNTFVTDHNLGVSQYGKFNGSNFTPNGELSSTDNTIEVIDGELIRP
jgi:hypothetical protein